MGMLPEAQIQRTSLDVKTWAFVSDCRLPEEMRGSVAVILSDSQHGSNLVIVCLAELNLKQERSNLTNQSVIKYYFNDNMGRRAR